MNKEILLNRANKKNIDWILARGENARSEILKT